MKILITGSTGMIGKGVLLVAIEDPRVKNIILLNRHAVDIKHPKVKEILSHNFYDLSPIAEQLTGIDACLYCLGISAVGIKEDEYNKVTYDLTLSLARHLKDLNPAMTFCYISGAGTDSTEKSSMMWARVKGKTENALFALSFKASYMFRPGLIIPTRGIKSRTRLYDIGYLILRPILPILKLFRSAATDTDKLARAMINVAIAGYHKPVLEMSDIAKASESRS